jgi:hypothetical protein
MSRKTGIHLGTIAILVLILATGVHILWSQETKAPAPEVKSSPGKDLQILSFTSKGELHDYMKTVSKTLGVSCKYCHNLEKGFDSNDPQLHKDRAREMMTMMNEINEKYFKETEQKMTCFVCHQGRTKPVFTQEEQDKIIKDSAESRNPIY